MAKKKHATKRAAVKTKVQSKTNVRDNDRERKIRERAYYIAEQRGFTPGMEERDWLAAERDIDTNQASH